MTGVHGLEAVHRDLFKKGMRRLAAGVTIVTTVEHGSPSGLTATAVCSLSAEPPQLLVCISRRAGAHDPVLRTRRFCVNVLARGHRRLAARFAGHDGVRGSDRFRSGRWTTLKTGAPVLADALAAFDCVIDEQVTASTHTIFIARIVDIALRQRAKPLLYASGSYASLQALTGGDMTRRARLRAAPLSAASRRRRGSRRKDAGAA